MKRIITDQEFRELAKKSQEGTATTEEQKTFDEAYELLLTRHSSWDAKLMGEKETVQSAISQALFDQVNRYEQKPKVFQLWKYLSAAVILVIASVSIYFFSLKPNVQIQQQSAAILPGLNNATLTLADGRKVNLNKVGNGALLEQAGIQITKSADGQLLYKVLAGSENIGGSADYNTIETPRGGQYQVILPDGTKVWLNAASSLKFPMSFAAMEDRKVELKGEAYFEVAKDKAHPFRVMSDDQEVKVLGTHFNINSYKDEGSIKTTLLEGSVVVTSNYNKYGSEAVRLKPGEQAILTERGIKVVEKELEQVIDWKNGDFIFQKEDLKEIMSRMARWYNVKVIYDQEVDQTLTFSGQMSRSKNMAEILKRLEETGEIKFEIKGTTVNVKNKD